MQAEMSGKQLETQGWIVGESTGVESWSLVSLFKDLIMSPENEV